MKGSKRPSDVSWASGEANLRKEDFRLKVGVKSKMISSKALRPKNHLAWYVAYNANPSEKKLAHMPQIKWKCPPKLVLDPGWHVVCGEESSEVDTQKLRESTVIEAVYPHLSAIPPSPLISPDMEGKHYDDSQIPLIPLFPIEEAGEIEMPFDTLAHVKTFNCHSTSESLNHSRFNSFVSPNPPTGENSLLNVLHGLEGGDLAVAAGAAATVAAAMESKHEIDTELLIKFLNDPEMMKTLINEAGIGSNSGPKSTMYPPLSNSTPDPSIDISVPVAMNQPIPIKESASDIGVTPAKHAHVCSPNLLNKWSPAPLRYFHPPLIQDLTNEAREPAIAHPKTHSTTGTNESRPLTSPTTLSYIENHYARLTDPQMVKTLVNETGIGATSEPRFPSGMKSTTYPPSSNSTPDPSIDIFVPVAMNQPIPIIESASDLGVTSAKRVDICSPNLVRNYSPAPPRSNSHPPLIQNLTNEAREPGIAHPRTHGTTGINEPRPLTSPTTLSYNENHYARLADPQMVKETGFGANSEPRFPSRLKSTTYALSSISTPGPGIDIFVPVAMNQPIPIKESASDLGPTLAKCTRQCSPNLLKSWSPAPLRSNSHPPLIQDLRNEAREPAIARSRPHGTAGTNEPRPLTAPTLSYNENQYASLINQYRVPIAAPIPLLCPPFSKPNWEAASMPIVNHHPPPYFTGIRPVSSPPQFSSTPRPYMRCMTDGFRSPDHAGLKPGPGSIPCTPFASELNCTSSCTFQPHPFPSMKKLPSPVENINYCKSQTKQDGETHIKNEDKLPKYGQPFNHLHELELAQHTSPLQKNATFQKPCMFFNSSKGCRKGSNCQYMHVMSRR